MRLQHWLRAHLQGFEGELDIERLAGGRSNPGWRLRTATRDCVLRARPGPRHRLLPSAHAIEREFRVQQALAGSAVPVAAMHALCEDESVVGAGFYVMDFVDGEIFRDPALPRLSPEGRAARYEAMLAAIADLHQLDVDALGLRDYGRPGQYFARQIDRWTRQYLASRDGDIPAMEKLIAWLPGAAPREDDEPEFNRERERKAARSETLADSRNGDERSPRHSIESLDSLSVDIARMIDHDAAIDLWDRYKRGERNVFTRRLYTLQGQQAFDEIRKKYRTDREFKQTVDRYVGEFERLLDEVSRDDRGQVVARTYLTSETGKVYTMLGHAAGRFD